MKTKGEIKSRILEVIKEINIAPVSSFTLFRHIPRRAKITLKHPEKEDTYRKHTGRLDYEIIHKSTISRLGYRYDTYIINLDDNLEPKHKTAQFLRDELRNNLYHRIYYKGYLLEAYNLGYDNEFFIYKEEKFTSLQQVIDRTSKTGFINL